MDTQKESPQFTIALVDLTTGEVAIEHPEETFMRRYQGGALGVYYLFQLTSPGFDPLSPENVLSFIPGVLAHLPLALGNRVSITAKSPLTGLVIDSQAGGYWGKACRDAGYDALVIQGAAEKPVYIHAGGDGVEVRDAAHLWGMDTGEAHAALEEEISQKNIQCCLIGPGGESLVRYANISNALRHFAGRGGLGAVMGSKNLKAVVAVPDRSISRALKPGPEAREITKSTTVRFTEDPFLSTVMRPIGTPVAVSMKQEKGWLPAFNFKQGSFQDADQIDHEAIEDSEVQAPSKACYACPVRCKRSAHYQQDDLKINEKFGGAEYESLINLGPLLGDGNLVAIQKANELCSRYTLDTISCGAVLAWAYDCYQQGILTREDTGGLELRFGDSALTLKLIEMIAHREGFGDLLAEGVRRAADQFGEKAGDLAAHTKGLEWPAVDPRFEPLQMLAYAVSPIGADHMTMGGPHIGPEFEGFAPADEDLTMPAEVVRAYYLQRSLGSFVDGAGICQFLIGAVPMDDLRKLFLFDLGWPISVWEMMQAGDRRTTLMRAFNAREGFTAAHDAHPPIAYNKIEDAAPKTYQLQEDDFEAAVEKYYQIAGWDPETGWPTEGKLLELGLTWLKNHQSTSNP
jgi:aldehyde:ferredoxin oxidoreductase